MNTETDAVQIATDLAEHLARLGVGNTTGFTGTTNRGRAGQVVLQAAAKLVNVLQNKRPKAEVVAALNTLDGDLHGAGLLGILSENELNAYLVKVDRLHDLIG